LIVICLALCGCAGSDAGCEEWATREVVDYNFCNGNPGAESAVRAQDAQPGKCVAPGTRQKVYCVKRPVLDVEPVTR